MEPIRKPFQGTWNIIRFNWDFYVLAAFFISAMAWVGGLLFNPYSTVLYVFSALIATSTILSLLVSLYIYDLSNLYSLNWASNQTDHRDISIVSIHAGFDETSEILIAKFPAANFTVLDFYDPLKHTEISIKRARRAYKPCECAIQVISTNLPLPDKCADSVFIVFAAHEIRNEIERISFFAEVKRIIKPQGKITVIEHLRDMPNFLAYNIGFFHFLSKAAWNKTFKSAGLEVIDEKKITPFVNIFNLS